MGRRYQSHKYRKTPPPGAATHPVSLSPETDQGHLNRAGGIGPAAPVLAGPVFSQGKSKIPFLQKASNKQSASVILGLIRLIILSYNT